jgi:hypothetical protein
MGMEDTTMTATAVAPNGALERSAAQDPHLYFHLAHNGGRVTLAVDVERRRVGVAWCRPGDQFARRKGRMIAAGRCEKRWVPMGIPSPGDDWMGRLQREALAAALAGKDVPTWARLRRAQ